MVPLGPGINTDGAPTDVCARAAARADEGGRGPSQIEISRPLRPRPLASPLINSVRTHFFALDLMRRAQGQVLEKAGFGPTESAYRVLVCADHWRLRDYGCSDAKTTLLIVASPIKRPYIWDLTPTASAIRYCLQHGLRICLIEWIAPPQSDRNVGLDEVVTAIAECVAAVGSAANAAKPFLIGHSLGGTLAAIFGACEPRVIRGLILLGSPLCFQPATSRFRDALVSIVPPGLTQTRSVAGALLSYASACASPHTFLWSRLIDAAMSIGDPHALDIHARIERWALDEVALPGQLVQQILEWLYRENRFCQGVLRVRDRMIGPACLDLPTLAVVNTADEVAPLASVAPFLDAMPTRDVSVTKYPGETGVALQHLGILVGRAAYAHVWPQILVWLLRRS